MKFALNTLSIWEFGTRKDAAGRPHQEDSLYPAHGAGSPSDRLFIVCDGMGGHEAGEVASATVVEALAGAIDTGRPGFTNADFEKALAKAFDALDQIQWSGSRKPGTTLALLWLHDEGATIAHMGDSRVYHIRPGETGSDTRILHVTSDHSLVNQLVQIGEMTPEEARTSSQRNVITRAMQPQEKRRPKADLHRVTDIRPGDYFYLCSDGMLEEMTDEQLCEIFSRSGGDINQKAARLVRDTEYNQDNHTAILVEITDVEGIRPATSIVTDEMSLQAAAASARLERNENRAVNSARRKRLLLWLTAAVVLAAAAFAAAWFLIPSGKHSAALTPDPAGKGDTVENTKTAPEPATKAVEIPAASTGAPAQTSQEARPKREAPAAKPAPQAQTPKKEERNNIDDLYKQSNPKTQEEHHTTPQPKQQEKPASVREPILI